MAEVDRRFGLVAQLQLEEALTYAELSERAVPAPTMHAARILLGTGDELNGDLAKLRKTASAATELRVLSALRDYCKAARQAMGSSRKADMAALGRSDTSRRLRLALQALSGLISGLGLGVPVGGCGWGRERRYGPRLPASPRTSLHLPASPCISLHLPCSSAARRSGCSRRSRTGCRPPPHAARRAAGPGATRRVSS